MFSENFKSTVKSYGIKEATKWAKTSLSFNLCQKLLFGRVQILFSDYDL